MAETISVAEFARNSAEYLNRVTTRSESFVIMKGKKAVAELKPVPRKRCLRELPEILRSLPHLSEEEAADFAKDVNEARV